MNYLSPVIEQLISSLQCLPGIGPKSARSLALYLLDRGRDGGVILSDSIKLALDEISKCKQCRFFTEKELCIICRSQKRDNSLICVVESSTDLIAIEESSHFNGIYFVLHGYLSPIDGIGPEDLGLDALHELVLLNKSKELVLAINPSLEGEATSHYIYNSMKDLDDLTISSLARGVPLSSEIEYLDEGTLTHAFQQRKVLDQGI